MNVISSRKLDLTPANQLIFLLLCCMAQPIFQGIYCNRNKRHFPRETIIIDTTQTRGVVLYMSICLSPRRVAQSILPGVFWNSLNIISLRKQELTPAYQYSLYPSK